MFLTVPAHPGQCSSLTSSTESPAEAINRVQRGSQSSQVSCPTRETTTLTKETGILNHTFVLYSLLTTKGLGLSELVSALSKRVSTERTSPKMAIYRKFNVT